jgi:uncharacterized protein (DUF362 family)
LTTIYLSKTDNRKKFVQKILEIFKEPLAKAERILIKLNIVSYEPYPTTTHPDVLDALLSNLSSRNVIVGDAPAVDAGSSKKILNQTSLKEICHRHGFPLVNFYSKGMKTVKSARGYRLKISTLPLKCDYIISLPVLKVHNICDLSGSLKNQFGYLSRLDRILMHSKLKNIHKGIAELNVVAPVNLFIVDAVETLVKAQECRHGGCQVKMGYMMAGTDPVSLDCFGLKILQDIEPNLQGKQPEDIGYIKYALTYGVGHRDFKVESV